MSIAGSSPRTIPFPEPLAWSTYVLGMPFADNTNRFAKATRREGNRVLAQSYNNKVFTVNLDDSSVASASGGFWPWFTSEQQDTFTAYYFNAVNVSANAMSSVT